MNKPTPSTLMGTHQNFPTASAAAVSALRSITVRINETGGGVLYNKGQNVYAATQPVGQGDGSHFAAAVEVPQGWQLCAIYHTHPRGYRSTEFSSDDINTAKQLKVPSYVLAYDDDKVRVFDPASSKVSKDGMFSDGAEFAYGAVVP